MAPLGLGAWGLHRRPSQATTLTWWRVCCNTDTRVASWCGICRKKLTTTPSFKTRCVVCLSMCMKKKKNETRVVCLQLALYLCDGANLRVGERLKQMFGFIKKNESQDRRHVEFLPCPSGARVSVSRPPGPTARALVQDVHFPRRLARRRPFERGRRALPHREGTHRYGNASAL